MINRYKYVLVFNSETMVSDEYDRAQKYYKLYRIAQKIGSTYMYMMN